MARLSFTGTSCLMDAEESTHFLMIASSNTGSKRVRGERVVKGQRILEVCARM